MGCQTNTITKTCFKCERQLPRSEFYAQAAMADGLLGKCKDCTRADVSEHRYRNLEATREGDRQRSLLPHRKAKTSTICREERAEHPEKSRARRMAGAALQAGRLSKRPCHFCGGRDKIEMHHPDYTKPLRVYWLCRICHRKLDSMIKQ